ncbi:NPCBM/NEW2 domain-containing protein [Brevibacillus ginsengisoli]|uniref:NPCBM/NEW2 domain-containing protein n=1 Tax=Brevibacillus ginsengisoli TaxID=363854 RepID=UPI003CEA2188
MKKFFAGFIAGAIVFGTVGVFAAQTSINASILPLKFIVNGLDKTPAQNIYVSGISRVPASVVYQGIPYVPAGLAASLIGQQYTYDANNKSIKFGVNDLKVKNLTDEKPYYASGYYAFNETRKIAGVEYKKNISMMFNFTSKPEFAYALNGNYKDLEFTLGLVDGYNTQDTKVTISADDKEIWSGTLKKGSLPEKIKLDVTGVLKIQFKYEVDEMSPIEVVLADAILKFK